MRAVRSIHWVVSYMCHCRIPRRSANKPVVASSARRGRLNSILVENGARLWHLFGPKSDKIGAYRAAFIYQEPLKGDFSTGSPVVNEVVLGTWVNKPVMYIAARL